MILENSPGPRPKGVLDPLSIDLLFSISFFRNTGRLPRGLVQPILLHQSLPHLPSIGGTRCFPRTKSEPEAPPNCYCCHLFMSQSPM